MAGPGHLADAILPGDMARFQRLACPSCGGALDVPTQHEQFFTCATCGATLEDTQYAAPTPQVSLSLADLLADNAVDTAALTSYAVRAGRTATRVGKIVAGVTTVAVLGGAGAGAYGIYRAVDTATTVADIDDDGFAMYSFANSALFPGEGATSEVALIVNGPDDAHLLYVDLGAADPVRWDAALGQLLPSDASIASYERIVASSGHVLITVEDGLYAFDRATGTAQYQLGLADSVSNICDECLQVFSDTTAVALTQDGTLRAWDVATGSGGWSVPLPGDVPRQLLNIDGQPGVIVDQPDDRPDGQRAMLTVFDLANGSVLGEQAPRCSGDAFPWPLSAYDHLVPLGGGSYVWLGTCPQRWSPGASAPDWELPSNPLGPSFVSALTGGELLAGERLVFTTDSGVATIDVTDGSLAEIARDEIDRRHLIGVVGDMLVTTEHTSRGSGRWNVAGVDLTDPDGQAAGPAWSLPLEGEPGTDGSITSEEWLVGVTPAGVAVVQLDVDAGTVRTQVVDPATGAASAPAALTLDDMVFAEFVGWRNGNLLLGADNRLLAIDPATATIVTEAP